MNEFRLLSSASNNPYFNLAAESCLVDADSGVYFFLWVNSPTVVIGYNQNPFSECALDKMREKNVFLARRRTGGGAVFHDVGNLNFSFVMPHELYDVKRQSLVICNALKRLGIDAEISGRNDLLAGGRKFSGNAYYKGKTHRLHHGTIMLNVDFNALSGYLTPDPSKYLKKGVSSVRSRVVNLCELKPELTIQELKNALFSAFRAEYGVSENVKIETIANEPTYNALAKEISSDEYLYKRWRDFSCDITADFSWGHVKACVKTSGGKIEQVIFSTDGLFPAAVDFSEKYLSACCGVAEKPLFPESFTEDDKKVFFDLTDLIIRR